MRNESNDSSLVECSLFHLFILLAHTWTSYREERGTSPVTWGHGARPITTDRTSSPSTDLAAGPWLAPDGFDDRRPRRNTEARRLLVAWPWLRCHPTGERKAKFQASPGLGAS